MTSPRHGIPDREFFVKGGPMTTPDRIEFPDLKPSKVIELASEYRAERVAPCTDPDGHEWVWEETGDEVLYQQGLCLNDCRVLVARKNPVFEPFEGDVAVGPPEVYDVDGQDDEPGVTRRASPAVEAARTSLESVNPHTCPYCGTDRTKAGKRFAAYANPSSRSAVLGIHKRHCALNPNRATPKDPRPASPPTAPAPPPAPEPAAERPAGHDDPSLAEALKNLLGDHEPTEEALAYLREARAVPVEGALDVLQGIALKARLELEYLRGWQHAAREFIDAWKQIP